MSPDKGLKIVVSTADPRAATRFTENRYEDPLLLLLHRAGCTGTWRVVMGSPPEHPLIEPGVQLAPEQDDDPEAPASVRIFIRSTTSDTTTLLTLIPANPSMVERLKKEIARSSVATWRPTGPPPKPQLRRSRWEVDADRERTGMARPPKTGSPRAPEMVSLKRRADVRSRAEQAWESSDAFFADLHRANALLHELRSAARPTNGILTAEQITAIFTSPHHIGTGVKAGPVYLKLVAHDFIERVGTKCAGQERYRVLGHKVRGERLQQKIGGKKPAKRHYVRSQ